MTKDKKVLIKTHRDKKGGHPHVILENLDDCHVSVGLSTKKAKGKGSTNYSLEKSPLNDGKHSYMRRQGSVSPIKEYTRPRQGTMTVKDYSQAILYGSRAKEKYLLNKKKKRRAKR